MRSTASRRTHVDARPAGDACVLGDARGHGQVERQRRILLVASLPCVLLAACGPLAMLTRPEGNGGWNAEHRARELERFAAAAVVDLEPRAATTGAAANRPAALNLRDALH